jgi:CheY-like chemotaxis protein
MIGGVSRAQIPVWLIDDGSEHHAAARATVSAQPRFSFTGFLDPEEALETYERLAQSKPQALPRIVLMDYYLGDTRGDDVTKRLRALQPAASRLTIVGYSSVAAGSERIVSAGADLIVRKHRDADGRNPSLTRFLQDVIAAERKTSEG